jgi:hypothetical protein
VVILDGQRIEESFIPLVDDGQRHDVVVSPGVPG